MTRCMGFAVLTAGVAWAASVAAQAAGNDLTVKVTDVIGNDGAVLIALFTTPDGFTDNFARAAKTATVPPGKATHTFAGLPAGRYVIVVGHDRNTNGKIDKSAFGPPKEPIGLSNHPKLGLRIRPDFDKAKVEVAKPTTVEVNLIEFGR